MANYPFRINMKSKLGTHDLAWYTGSLATDADSQISASVMVDRINNIPSASYEDGVATPSGTSAHLFGAGRNLFMSCSHTDANIGAIEFHDEENTVGGGLEYYTFWGAKVCSVLGLPEGIPIYTENFKLSDDSNDPDNYISGDIIAGGLAVKDSLRLSPQARVRSNLVWDEEFGEGLVQWVSGSTGKLLMGYDNITDRYKISAADSSTFKISGVTQISGSATDGGSQPFINFASSINLASGKFFVGNVSGDLTGNVEGSFNSSSPADPAPHADPVTISGSESNYNSGGNVEIKGGNNLLGNPLSSDIYGGNIILTPGIAAATIDLSSGGSDLINGTVQINGDAQIRATDKFYLDGGGNTYLTEDSADSISVVVGGTTQAIIDSVQQRHVVRQNIYIQGATPTANSIDDDYLRFHNNGSNSYIDYGGGTLYIRDDGTTAITVDTSRNVTIANDLFVNDYARIDALRVGTTSTDPADGNLHVEGTIQSEDGIRFGSDSAAANILHDYEEGNWTPALYNSGTVTTTDGNHYVKVGSLVTCWMKLVNIQESGTQTADFAISGLPFAVEFDCVGGTVMANGFDFADDPDNVNNLTIWVKTDETLRIYETKDANASWDAITWGDITDNDDLYGQFTYRTTA